MYGKIVSSNGLVEIEDEYTITLEENIRFLSVSPNFQLLLYINNETDAIFVEAYKNFEMRDLPISSFRIKRVKAYAAFYNEDPLIYASWYGLY